LAWLLANRRLTFRYERRADILTALLHLAFALICARKLQPLCTTATSPSALRHPPTPGRFRLGPSRAALPLGIQRLLEPAPFCLRDDLDEHDYDDPGPE
jgi:hypothetical protein